MAATRELKVVITGDASSLQKSLGKAADSSSKLGGRLKTLGKAAALAGVALGTAVAVGAVKAIDAASDLGEQINKTNVVFGKSGREVEKWSQGLASSFGLSQRAALEAAGTYGNMLVPMGFSRKEASKMSKSFVELAADMASFNNASPQETLDALRAGLAGETEPLRRFGVFLNDARIKSEAAAMGFKLVKGQLDPMAKAAATAAIIMKDTADTQGDFGRTSDSLANQQRILRAELENAAAAIGNALLPAATALMQLLVRIIPVVTEWGTKLAEAVGPVLTQAVAGLTPLFNNFKNVLQDMLNVARQIYPTFQQIVSTGFGFAVSSWGQSLGVATIAMLGFHAAAVRTLAVLATLRTAGVAAAITSLLNPLTLATVGVGLLAGILFKLKIDADNAAAGLDRTKAALEGLKDAANESVQADQRLTESKIALKQATLNVTTALKQRNRLEEEGKRATDEYKQAQLNVQQAYAGRRRASIELDGAQRNVTDSTKQGSTALRNLWKEADTADESFRKVKGGLFGLISPFQVVKTNVDGYIRAMNKLAKEADSVAKEHQKSNPQIAQGAREFASSARAAAKYAEDTGKIPGKLSEVAPQAKSAGTRVGASFGAGIVSGIDSYTGAIATAAARAVSVAEASARSQARAKSPSILFALLGRDLAIGLANGIDQGKTKAAQKAAEMIQKAYDAVIAGKDTFVSAFENLANEALGAFDAAMSQWKPKAQIRLDRLQTKEQLAQLKQDITDAGKGVNEARDQATRNVQEAQSRLAKAQAEGDPEAIREAQQAVTDAIREGEQGVTDALASQLAARRALRDFNLQQDAAKQQEAHDKEAARDRIRFQNQLTRLQNAYGAQEISTKEFHKRLNKLLKQFGVDAEFYGTALGIGFANGIENATGAVVAAITKLLKKVEALLKLQSPAKEGPLSDLDKWWEGLIPTLMGGVDTRQLRNLAASMRNELAVTGARIAAPATQGVPLFTPSTAGSISMLAAGGGVGGGILESHTHVYLDSTQISEVIRREYLRFEKRNGRAAI